MRNSMCETMYSSEIYLVANLAGSNMSDDHGEEGGDAHPGQGGALLLEEQKPQLKRPSLYRVVLMNDDYTPMEFVVDVLMSFFAMSYEKAHEVMLTVHTKGKGVCGVYTRDVAETKAMQVNQYARDNEHPLLAEVEEAPDGDDDENRGQGY